MKRLFILIVTLCAFGVAFGQQTAQDYFNISARLYAEKQQEQALYMVSRGCEVYEADSSLAQLKRLIEGKGNQNQQNKKQQNKDNKDQQNQDKQNQQNQSNQGQGQNNQNKQDSQNGNQNQQNNEQQGQQQQAQTAQQGNDNKPGDKKGQISAVQAEALLDAIEGNDKAVQLRLNQQKKNNKKNSHIEKNW